MTTKSKRTNRINQDELIFLVHSHFDVFQKSCELPLNQKKFCEFRKVIGEIFILPLIGQLNDENSPCKSPKLVFSPLE